MTHLYVRLDTDVTRWTAQDDPLDRILVWRSVITRAVRRRALAIPGLGSVILLFRRA
jgi:hypothetical protein